MGSGKSGPQGSPEQEILMRLAVKGSGNWDGKKKFIFTNS